LGLTKSPQYWFIGTEKPDGKVADGKEANEEEHKTAFGFEFSPESPHYSKNYQAP
jgi:hypothetical protein